MILDIEAVSICDPVLLTQSKRSVITMKREWYTEFYGFSLMYHWWFMTSLRKVLYERIYESVILMIPTTTTWTSYGFTDGKQRNDYQFSPDEDSCAILINFTIQLFYEFPYMILCAHYDTENAILNVIIH